LLLKKNGMPIAVVFFVLSINQQRKRVRELFVCTVCMFVGAVTVQFAIVLSWSGNTKRRFILEGLQTMPTRPHQGKKMVRLFPGLGQFPFLVPQPGSTSLTRMSATINVRAWTLGSTLKRPVTWCIVQEEEEDTLI
jgi:hypothetical protein